MTQPIRVLIVDDSKIIRGLLRATIASDARLQVAGEAADPYEARELIKQLNPDVLTLDVEMPRMNGLDFLEKLMRLRPMPVVVVSTRTRDRSAEALRALSLGAVDCLDVSRLQVESEVRHRLLALLVAAGGAQVHDIGAARAPRSPAAAVQPFSWNGLSVFIGSSTGGVDALERVLGPFPADCPPTLIAQHMPAPFLEGFARRLDGMLAPSVAIAEGGEELAPGRILISGGGCHHLTLAASGSPRTVLVPAEPGDLYVPLVDRLFGSAAALGRRALGVILTGMGRDGSQGLLEMRMAGARTLAQAGESCVIDGMPRAAREAGAVERSVPLDLLGADILRICSRMETQVS